VLKHLLLAIIILTPSTTAFAQTDPLQVLATHNIVSNGVNYEPSGDFQIEESFITGIIRIHGYVSSGEPFALYLKSHDPKFNHVVFLKDGHFQPSELKEIPKTTEQGFGGNLPETTEEKTESKDFKILLSQPFRNFWKQQFNLDVRVYESNTNNLNNISFNEGYMEGLDVKVTIYDNNGNVFKEFSGVTDNKGYFKESFIITENLTLPGEYTTIVEVSDNIQTKTIQDTFFVIADTTASDSSELDSDGDGVPDSQDNFPNDPNKS